MHIKRTFVFYRLNVTNFLLGDSRSLDSVSGHAFFYSQLRVAAGIL